MKKIIVIILTFALLITTFITSLKYIESKSNNVKDGYIIVFRGETIDKINSTYVYKEIIKKKKKKITNYKYIYTVITKNNVDYTYSLEKVVSKGETKDIDKIIKIVENNNSTTYAEVRKNNLLINIEQYKEYLN